MAVTPFGLPVSCPDCGGGLELVNARATGQISVAILVCGPCAWEYEVLMRIERHSRSVDHDEHVRGQRRQAKVRARHREAVAG